MAMVPYTLHSEEPEVRAWRVQAQPVLYSEILGRGREGDGETAGERRREWEGEEARKTEVAPFLHFQASGRHGQAVINGYYKQ